MNKLFRAVVTALVVLSAMAPASADPKANLAKMQAALDARKQFYCYVTTGNTKLSVERTSKDHYTVTPSDGPAKVVTDNQIPSLDAATGRAIVLCESAGLGFGPLNLAKITDLGNVHKFSLDLRSYRVAAGSDGTRSTATVLIWPDHRYLPIETTVHADGYDDAKLEYSQFDGVMTHE